MRGLRLNTYSASLLLALAGLLAGCADESSSLNRADRDPLIRRARAMQASHDYEGAIAMYNRALDKNSALAQAHLEVGQVYDQHKNDKLRAIYHYQRFLELSPASEKADLVRELIRIASISYASSLPTRPSEAVREVDMLKKEVATLRALLAEKSGVAQTVATARAAAPVAAPPAPAPVPVPVAAVAAPAPAPAPAPAAQPETYTVRPGDTLSRIATRVYGDAGKWDVIYEANKQALPSSKNLKVGQTLIIPRK